MLANESKEHTQFTPDETQCQEEESQSRESYYKKLKVLDKEDKKFIDNFNNLPPYLQEVASHEDILKYTDLCLKGFIALSELHYPVQAQGANGEVVDSGQVRVDRLWKCLNTTSSNKKIKLWDRTNFEAVRTTNKEKGRKFKALSKSRQEEKKQKLIQAFLDKEASDTKPRRSKDIECLKCGRVVAPEQGCFMCQINAKHGEAKPLTNQIFKDQPFLYEDSLLFPKQATIKHTKSRIPTVLYLKRTLAEEYDYFLKRDKRELQIQNEVLDSVS